MYRKKTFKLTYLLIAIIIIYNSFGYMLLFFPVKIIIKKIVQQSIEKKEIDKEELIILGFNFTDLSDNNYGFKWVKINKEFRFNGKMYDVEKTIVKGDSIFFTCYYDHKENILEELFTLHFTNTKNDKNQSQNNRIVFIGLYSEKIKIIQTAPILCSASISILKNEGCRFNHVQDVLTPPPRNIS